MPLAVHSIQMGLSCAYLLEGEGGLVLVDAGSPHSERLILRRLRALGQGRLRLIFITHAHFDHYGSAAVLRRLTGAPVAIHRADAEAMARGESRLGSVRGWGRVGRALFSLAGPLLRPEPTPADLVVDDGHDLGPYGLDGVVVHTPGHTAGSSCLLVAGQLAFVGDLASTAGRPQVQSLYAQDWSLIPGSLARLQALRPEWIYTGHGLRPLSGEAFQRL